MEEPNTPQNF